MIPPPDAGHLHAGDDPLTGAPGAPGWPGPGAGVTVPMVPALGRGQHGQLVHGAAEVVIQVLQVPELIHPLAEQGVQLQAGRGSAPAAGREDDISCRTLLF